MSRPGQALRAHMRVMSEPLYVPTPAEEFARGAEHGRQYVSAGLLSDVASLGADLERFRELGVYDATEAADALSVVRHIAGALDVPADNDGAIQDAFEALQKKAQQWDAATAAGALDHSGILKAYNAAADLSFEGALAAVVDHVRAHDAAARAAEPVADVSPSEGPIRIGDTVECVEDPGDFGIVTDALDTEHVWARWGNGSECDFPASVLRVVKRAEPRPGEVWFCETHATTFEASDKFDDNKRIMLAHGGDFDTQYVTPGLWRYVGPGSVPLATAAPSQPTAAPEPGDAIAEWLANHRVGNVRTRDWVVSGDDVRRLARAFTALVAEVRSLRAGRECGGEE